MEFKQDPDDYWAQAVSLFTGFGMPSRSALFDKLKSKEGIPLMRVNIVEQSIRPVRVDDYGRTSGWQIEKGTDYRVTFYFRPGKDVKMYTAEIIFIGTLADQNGQSHLMEGEGNREGGAFKGKYGDEWDDADLWRYVSGPKVLLDALINEGSTKGKSYSGLSVADADAVEMKSFERSAQAFDRAADFFRKQQFFLDLWEKSMGGDKASWKGQSAGVVWNLMRMLNKNYTDYLDQLKVSGSPIPTIDGYVPETKYANVLAKAQNDLNKEVKELRWAWSQWAKWGHHDPHRSLLEELDNLVRWLLVNNVPHIEYAEYDDSYRTDSAFQGEYKGGALNDIATWKAIGEQAVRTWSDHIDQWLTPSAKSALSNLGSNWSAAAADAESPLRTRGGNSLSDKLEEEKLKSEKEKTEKALNDANKKQKEAWSSLNKNLSDSNANNKEFFDGINKNLTNANDNQKLLNDNLSGFGDSVGDGLTDLGNGLTKSLNPDVSDLNPDVSDLGPDVSDVKPGGGSFAPLNGDIGDLGSDFDTSSTGPLADSVNNSGGYVPLNNLNSLLGNTSGASPGYPLGTSGPQLDENGNLVQNFPDGSRSVFNPETGDLTRTDPQGNTTTTHLNPGDVLANPDGSSTQLNPDGTLSTEFPDGTSQVFDPADGTLSTTKPDGTHTTTNLNDPVNLNGGDPFHTGTSPLNGAFGTGASLVNASAHGTGLDPEGSYLDYDSTPFTGGALGGPLGGFGAVGASAAGATAPGGMPAGGMGGMGGMGAGGAGAGAGGSGANGERVRNVMTDVGGSAARRPNPVGSVVPDGEDLPFRRGGQATSSQGTPMGGAPMGGGTQGGQSTESGERQRAAWVEEDDDVWGTEEGGSPAVIG